MEDMTNEKETWLDENGKVYRDFTGLATNKIYKEVRRMLTEDFLEFLTQKYTKVKRLSTTDIAVCLGFVTDEDGFPWEVCGLAKAQSKPFYDKSVDVNGNELKRPVVMFNIDDAAEEAALEIKSKGVPKK
jgi:hypothetical protein